MFTYLVLNPGISFGGIDLTGRIYTKDVGVAHLLDAPDNVLDLSAAELNALPAQSFNRFTVAFSEQDIPEDEFLEWAWDSAQFNQLSGAQITEIQAFLTNVKQMWADRKQKLRDLKVDIIQENDWTNLTKQHRMILVGAELKDFKENDWAAQGLDDLTYLGTDFNYTFAQWDKFRKYMF